MVSISFSNAVLMEEGNLYKQKQELIEIRDELNEFYELKELKYQKEKSELEATLAEIKKEELVIKKLHDETKVILGEMRRELVTKSMMMYDKMKLGVVVNIFNEMIKDNELDEVFDILLRLKDKRVIQILKKLETKISTIIMKKMRVHKDRENKQKKKGK
jgi:flagellar motility protein MotE (MotC chaperone)